MGVLEQSVGVLFRLCNIQCVVWSKAKDIWAKSGYEKSLSFVYCTGIEFGIIYSKVRRDRNV